MEFVRLRAHQYQKFDGSVVQNAKNGRTLSGADAPALPKGELFYFWRTGTIKLPLSGELAMPQALTERVLQDKREGT